MDIYVDKSDNETREWAVFMLALSGIGFLLSFPCRDTFWGGLLASGFGASLVGGITDWFAVVSLFRKPFGIRFFRAVIPSKKDEIIESLVTMVEKDLLSPENIERSIRNHDLTLSINELLKRKATKNIIRTFLKNIAIDLLKTQDLASLSSSITDVLIDNMSRIRFASIGSIINQVAKWSEKKGYLAKVVVFSLNEINSLLSDSEFRIGLANATEDVLKGYKRKGGPGRSALVSTFEMLGKSYLDSYIQSEAIAYIDKLKNDADIGQKCLIEIREVIENLEKNTSIKDWIENTILKLRENPKRISTTILEFLSSFEEEIRSDKGVAQLVLNSVTDMIYNTLVNLSDNPQKQKYINNLLRVQILNLVSENHQQIGELVRKTLNQYPEGELERMIEQRVGEDLQILRCTGTLIGGVTGSLVFIINQVILGIIR